MITQGQGWPADWYGIYHHCYRGRAMRSDGLVLRVGTPETDPSKALKLAKRIVRQDLSGEWVVRPMGSESRDFSVRRKRPGLNPTVAQAFGLGC